eukprot:scaffold654_cov148-Skeletonema_menzelii.AAC.6
MQERDLKATQAGAGSKKAFLKSVLPTEVPICRSRRNIPELYTNRYRGEYGGTIRISKNGWDKAPHSAVRISMTLFSVQRQRSAINSQ